MICKISRTDLRRNKMDDPEEAAALERILEITRPMQDEIDALKKKLDDVITTVNRPHESPLVYDPLAR
jgi:hypothetical protein